MYFPSISVTSAIQWECQDKERKIVEAPVELVCPQLWDSLSCSVKVDGCQTRYCINLRVPKDGTLLAVVS